MHRSMRRREEIGASPQTRAAQTPPAGPTAAGGRIRPRLRAKASTAAPALPRRAGARTAGLPPATDETRNYGEINRELLLRPEAEVVIGRAVRRCRPTARFVRFLQPEAADANRRTYRRASPRETKSGAPIVVANLVLRTTGVLDRREAGRPGCCYRPRASVSSRSAQTSPFHAAPRRSRTAASKHNCLQSVRSLQAQKGGRYRSSGEAALCCRRDPRVARGGSDLVASALGESTSTAHSARSLAARGLSRSSASARPCLLDGRRAANTGKLVLTWNRQGAAARVRPRSECWSSSQAALCSRPTTTSAFACRAACRPAGSSEAERAGVTMWTETAAHLTMQASRRCGSAGFSDSSDSERSLYIGLCCLGCAVLADATSCKL